MAPSATLGSKVTQTEKSESIIDDDDEGWEDMPVIREDDFANGLDEEDRRKYHYVTPSRKDSKVAAQVGNATGNLIDFDDRGNEWREKQDTNENEYTRLRLNEENDVDEVHLRTRYLFDEDKAMTPLSQMQATKNLLTEAQRIAYVGLCALTSREMSSAMKIAKAKELKAAVESMELWALKIMGRLYYHMELETQEQKMIASLAEHGVMAADLVPSLMTTHTVANPEYDPAEGRKRAQESHETERVFPEEKGQPVEASHMKLTPPPYAPTVPPTPNTAKSFQTTANVLTPNSPVSVPGVSTSLSSADENVTLDIRWTVLCDLFLIIIADSVYDARSRVLLEAVAEKLGLGWLDIVKFEQRVTEALEIQEGVEKLEQKDVIDGRMKAARKRRYAMMGLATLGGGLVIGLSAGLLAPVIGAGLGAAFATIGVSGTTGFLAGAGGAAVITTAGTLTGSGIAVRGMARRTQQVRTFDLLPLHNNKRVNCIVTVSGFMNSVRDDVRLPFSVLDPIVGDVFSVHWEPEMLGEAGSALKILGSEVLSQVGTTVLQATVMTALMSALQWPILLTKLGYLIDNPWSNALDRSKAAGSVLADVLIQRHLGVRPITLIGFSLGARMIFFCLLELAKQKAFGIVQDVFLLGATVTAPRATWLQARSVVAGRFVNGYARNDWILNYLFRATNAGLNNIAGLRPVQGVPGLENVDLTDKIAGHSSYRTFMPLILDQLGFPVSSDYFDEPEEPDMTEDRMIVRENEEAPKKKGWFSRKSKTTPSKRVSRAPPSTTSPQAKKEAASADADADADSELPDRIEEPPHASSSPVFSPPISAPSPEPNDTESPVPMHAGFDFSAIKEVIEKEGPKPDAPLNPVFAPIVPPPSMRSESAPPLVQDETPSRSTTPVQRSSLEHPGGSRSAAGPSSRRDLPAVFSRSLSMGDADEDAGGPSQSASLDDVRSSAESFGRRRPPAPTLSFGAVDGGVWTPGPPRLDSFGALGQSLDNIASSVHPQSTRPAPVFAGSDDNIWAPPPPPKDLFTGLGKGGGSSLSIAPSTSSPPEPFAYSSTALAFGRPDGSISSHNAGNDRDQWRPPPFTSDAKRTATAFNPNPWQ